MISSERLIVELGLTFKSIRVTKPNDAPSTTGVKANNAPSVLFPTVTIVYFDQSRYELKPQARATLDSVAQLLAGQSNVIATVTGYTDNVGNRDLNVTLSEYRAKVVENYLKQHGVLPNQIVANWKGPETKASAEDDEAVKVKSRRVVIQLAPK